MSIIFDGTLGQITQTGAQTFSTDVSVAGILTVRGMDPLGTANSAFGQANLAYTASNTAVTTGQANVGAGLITTTSAYQANSGAGLISLSSSLTSAYQANVGAGLIATASAAQTLTNKRIDPRVLSTTSSASAVTPDISAYDIYAWTAQAATLTINAPIGTPLNGDKLIFRILDNGTSQTLSWNATFTAMSATLPTVTTPNKMTYVGCIYNAANTRWDVIALTTQA